jgi:hypothetical protein
MPAIKAFEEVTRCSGTQYDPVLVEAFLKTSIVSSLKA